MPLIERRRYTPFTRHMHAASTASSGSNADPAAGGSAIVDPITASSVHVAATAAKTNNDTISFNGSDIDGSPVTETSTSASTHEAPVASKSTSKKQDTALKHFIREVNQSCKHDDLPRGMAAWTAYRQLGRVVPIEMYANMIYLHARCKRMDGVTALLQEALASGQQVIESVFTVTIESFAQDGQVAASLEWLHRMKEYGLAPRSRTYCPILTRLAADNNIDTTYAIFNEMHAAHLQADEGTLDQLLQLVTRNKTPQAWQLARAIFISYRDNGSKISEVINGRVKALFQAHHPSWKIQETSVHHSGHCNGCGSLLESIQLTETQHRKLSTEVGKLLTDQPDLAEFQRWLKARGPVDVVVDGLNVGFYHSARYNAVQVDSVVKLCRSHKKISHSPGA